jgi:hypothetical protein
MNIRNNQSNSAYKVYQNFLIIYTIVPRLLYTPFSLSPRFLQQLFLGEMYGKSPPLSYNPRFLQRLFGPQLDLQQFRKHLNK